MKTIIIENPIIDAFDRVRSDLWISTLAVKIDKSTDFTVFEQCMSGKIIHSRVKAHIFYGEIRHMFFQLMEGNQGINGIMPFGTGKTEKQRDIDM